jgi:hypothetical protein
MKVRTLRKRAQNMMDTAEWWAAADDTTKMYKIRDIKPCKTYNPYCSSCNAVLFRQEMARFPYNIIEFNEYEQAKQDLYDPQTETEYAEWTEREMLADANTFQQLADSL